MLQILAIILLAIRGILGQNWQLQWPEGEKEPLKEFTAIILYEFSSQNGNPSNTVQLQFHYCCKPREFFS